MRHGFSKRRFNRSSEHRVSMLRSMACSLIQHERIKTTLQKAKELRPIVEHLVTLARSDSLAARRRALSRLHANHSAVKKLFEDLGPRFAKRPGGYIRIMHAGHRYGDAADMAVVEFVEKKEQVISESVA